jgi:hypothetical protein
MGSGTLQKSFFPRPEFLQVMEGIFRKCGQDDRIIFMGTARQIWMRRNEVLHGGNFVQPGMLVQLVKKSIEEFQQAYAGEDAICQSSSRPEMSSWLTPTQGWVKVNWDATLDSKAGWMGYRVLIRDHNGQVRAARSVTQQGLLILATAEARAAFVAIQFCWEMGFSRIHLEGDAKGVIEAVKNEALNYSKLGHLVEDIKLSLALCRISCNGKLIL